MESVGVAHDGSFSARLVSWEAPEGARAPRIAVAEDDDDFRDAVVALFSRDGCLVTSLPDGTSLLRHLARCAEDDLLPDVLILDHLMPGVSGLQICEQLWELDRPMPVVLVTAFGSAVGRMARRLGARVVDKPCPGEQLRAAVFAALADAWAERPGFACASCGATGRVRVHPLLAVPICQDCLALAHPPDADDELGVVD